MLIQLGLTEGELDQLVERCRTIRRALGQPMTRWTRRALIEVLAAAVLDADWPAAAAVPALLEIAGDRATRSPARLTCAGPWWDVAEAPSTTTSLRDAEELARLEQRLAEADGHRVRVQRLAREQLTAAGESVTRLAVARLAVQYLGSGRSA